MSWDEIERAVAAKDSAPLLTTLLNKFLATQDYDNPAPPLRAPGLHISGLAGICARREALTKLYPGKAEKGGHDAETKRTFNVGTMYHRWYQERYFGPMGILKGGWRCSRCLYWEWGYMPVGPCPKCAWGWPKDSPGHQDATLPTFPKMGWWTYEEPWVQHKELGIVGHMDGIVTLDGEDYGLEIKTMNVQGFRKLTSPHAHHVQQQWLYMALADTCPHIPAPLEKGIMLYIGKDRAWGLGTEKEFINHLDRSWFSGVVGEVGRLKEFESRYARLQKALEHTDLPDRIQCQRIDSPTAQSCSLASKCFAV